jgi:acyl-coenzyme A thioesterase 9
MAAARAFMPARLASSLRKRALRAPGNRLFHATGARATDGVYKELTEMRVRTPWIEALRRSKATSSQSAAGPEDPPKPDLTPKRMSDSYVRIVLPLQDDPWMLDTYANYSGQLRTGSLLMDLDALAGVVAYKHTGEGVSTVTAAVDRITIKNPLKEICNLELSGQVTFATGRSSMEVTLQIAKAPGPGQQVKPEDVFMTCAMTMVSLDPQTKKVSPEHKPLPVFQRGPFTRGTGPMSISDSPLDS